MNETWDFFIAYSHRDAADAKDLYGLLTRVQARVFLDDEHLAPGSTWDLDLKHTMARSRISVVLISPHTKKAWYQREEIAIAIELARKPRSAHTIVPVWLSHTRREHVPYGLTIVHSLKVGKEGLPPIADALVRFLRKIPERPSTERLARATAMLDDLWSRAEPALTDHASRMPEQFRLRFMQKGQNLVSRYQGKDQVRLTREQFESTLNAEQLAYVQTLEKSMEINLALWNKTYPKRTLDRRSARKVAQAIGAMGEDLDGVLRMLEAAGFWLDDHYLAVRNAVQKAK